MNIIVCIKQVPAKTNVRINPETNTLIRPDAENIINPYDTHALEEGVRLKERFGGSVTVITMGPPQAEAMLREAISCGADEAILISDAVFAGADTLATSYTLAKAIQKVKQYDLIICGRQSVDGDTGQVGAELAETLDIALVSYVSQVEDAKDGTIRVRRMTDDGYEVFEADLPALITVVKEINTPRLPSLRGRARSKSAVIPVWKAPDLEVEKGRVGLAGSSTRVTKVFAPQRTSHAEIIQGSPEEQVEALIRKLRENQLI